MFDILVVGLIVAVAAWYVVRRFVAVGKGRGGCGCGCSGSGGAGCGGDKAACTGGTQDNK